MKHMKIIRSRSPKQRPRTWRTHRLDEYRRAVKRVETAGLLARLLAWLVAIFQVHE